MIKAVVFDCFGVLIEDGWRKLREERFLNDVVKLAKAHEIDDMVNAGLMSYEEFIDSVAELAGLSNVDVLERFKKVMVNDELFDFIRDKVKSNYKIGLLSNAADNWLDQFFKPWQVELFDAVTLSYEIGFVKPDRRIYETISSKLGLEFEEILFTDDQLRYCKAATKLGIQTIHFETTEQFKRDFQNI